MISGGSELAHEVMPRVHKVAALLETVVVGSPGRHPAPTSRRLPRRIHLPLQSASITGPRPPVPPPRPAGGGDRPAPYDSIIKPRISANLPPNWGNKERDTHFSLYRPSWPERWWSWPGRTVPPPSLDVNPGTFFIPPSRGALPWGREGGGAPQRRPWDQFAGSGPLSHLALGRTADQGGPQSLHWVAENDAVDDLHLGPGHE